MFGDLDSIHLHVAIRSSNMLCVQLQLSAVKHTAAAAAGVKGSNWWAGGYSTPNAARLIYIHTRYEAVEICSAKVCPALLQGDPKQL